MMLQKNICKWFFVCPIKQFTDEHKLDEKWIRNFCKKDWKKCKRYQLEEKGIPHSDCLLPNGKIIKELCKE